MLLGARLPAVTSAQDATPMAMGTCPSGPVDTARILSLWYDANHNLIASSATPSAATPVPSEVTILTGPPADQATVDGVTQTVENAFACFAAGDFAHALSLFSDTLAASFGPEIGTSYEDAEAFLTSPPQPDPNQSTLVSVANVMTLGNDRAAVIVVEHYADFGDVASEGILTKQGDQWLIDQIIDFPSRDDSTGD